MFSKVAELTPASVAVNLLEKFRFDLTRHVQVQLLGVYKFFLLTCPRAHAYGFPLPTDLTQMLWINYAKAL